MSREETSRETKGRDKYDQGRHTTGVVTPWAWAYGINNNIYKCICVYQYNGTFNMLSALHITPILGLGGISLRSREKGREKDRVEEARDKWTVHIYQQPSDLKNGCPLFILVHLGGQAVELQCHAPQVGKELVFIRLFSKEADGVLQALKVVCKIAVLVLKGLYVLKKTPKIRDSGNAVSLLSRTNLVLSTSS